MAAWLAVQTQWRLTAMGAPSGLDYAGVEAALRLRGESDPEIFAALQVCERAALEALRDRREREQLGTLLSGG